MNILRNQKGLGMIEILISSLIMITVLGSSVYVFTKQNDVIIEENDNTKIRAQGRQAMQRLVKEIRMAGFGLPPAAAYPTVTDPHSISFLANLELPNGELARTQIAGTAGIATLDPSITVLSNEGFQVGDAISIYHPSFRKMEMNTVGGLTGTDTITLGTPFVSDNFRQVTNAELITVNKASTITIDQNGHDVDSNRGDYGAYNLVNDVAIDGLTFDYEWIDIEGDGVDDMVSKIGITLELIDATNTSATVKFYTDVSLRNLGLKG